MKPKALILRSAGTNCDLETAYAFELAGAQSVSVHLNRLLESPDTLREFQMMAIPGGFSYGDDIAAGKILARQLAHHLYEPVREFIAAGKPIIGICNGFQVLVKTDLLPGMLGERTGQLCTLTGNDCGRFVDRWIHLGTRSSKCIWTADLQTFELPVAHGEGKFVPADEQVRTMLWQSNQVVLVYSQEDGSPARGTFPANPNGSVDDIAGVGDETGLVFGLMPHPERHGKPFQHYAWTSSERSATDAASPGLRIFRNAVQHVQNAVGRGV